MHGAAQAPQCINEVFVSVSQPFRTSPSQLPNPALHAAMLHVPPLHDPVAFAGMHGAAQAPQCINERVVSVSQPFRTSPSQLPNPALHAAMPHVPPLHDGVARSSTQGMPQPPQCCGLVAVSTQLSSHTIGRSAGQSRTQPRAASHRNPAPHISPHDRQCAVVPSCASQPLLARSPSQFSKNGRQVYAHAPASQRVLAFATSAQGMPHPPQCVPSVRVSTSQPSAELPLQSANPSSHA
jgi:hypothetical protein